jgi:predicted dehydrogenase
VNKLRVAVVGVGYLGRFHAEKYLRIPGVSLVAVADLDARRGAAVATTCETEFVADYRALLGRVDAVTVAASTSAHYELARFFLEHGVHVLVEKPIARSSEEALVLTELAERNRLKLQVGHVERFNPALLAAREKLQAVQFIECHRLAPFQPRGADVDVVLDLMIHDLDVILSLVDAEPASISAIGVKLLTRNIDIANARIEFASGAVANVTASRVSTSVQRKFRVFQQNQYLSIDFGNGEVELVTCHGEWREDQSPLSTESWNLEKGDALLAETASFVAAIRNDTPCVVNGRDGWRALRLAEQVKERIAERKPSPTTE